MARGNHTVLIADDYEADRLFLKEAIQLHAPMLRVVDEVSCGNEVIAYLCGAGPFGDREKYPLPDLLIIDIRMPRKIGIEVLRWLGKKRFPGLKVALLTDSSATPVRDEALALGPDHFYSRSADLADLVAVLKQLQAAFEGKQEGTSV